MDTQPVMQRVTNQTGLIINTEAKEIRHKGIRMLRDIIVLGVMDMLV